MDLLFAVAEALGDAQPSTTEWEWGECRKYISSLKTMYRFAGRQKFFELDPSLMVRFDRFITNIDDKVEYACKQTTASNSRDLEAWRVKYELWREKPDEN